MKFTKMHGAGNDYVYVNCFAEQIGDPEQVAIRVSNRNFGIGSDGLILIMPSDKADVRMRMFNSDGSESEMCGNGIRCVAKYAYDHGIVTKKEISAETGAGILTLQLFTNGVDKVEKVRVNMGAPRLTRAQIPMLGDPQEGQLVACHRLGRIGDEEQGIAVSPGSEAARQYLRLTVHGSHGQDDAIGVRGIAQDRRVDRFDPRARHYRLHDVLQHRRCFTIGGHAQETRHPIRDAVAAESRRWFRAFHAFGCSGP